MRPKLSLEVIAALTVALAVTLFGLTGLAVAALNIPLFEALAVYAPRVSTQTIILNLSVATYTPPPTNDLPTPSPTLTQTPTPTPAWTPTPTDSAPPVFDFRARDFAIGQSAQGRPITGIGFPSEGESARALVFVSGIHGDETNAWPILQSLISDLESGSLARPLTPSLYFIPAFNADGVAADRRLNANKIDLNRNWETYDWQPGIELSPTDFFPNGGGSAPFSEPETRAMRDWLLALQAAHPGGVTVIYFHAAFAPNGLVMPGTHFVDGRDLADTPSRELGEVFAATAGYAYSNRWPGDYRVTGDASTWAVAHDMRSLTVELPVRGPLDAEQSAKLREAILMMMDTLQK
ncbi:MAG: DUF2817 domain-containing protein [Chloroflexi bacterium]|nr:DUF2817 domain-containing protein [Chloroflexota bacterium]